MPKHGPRYVDEYVADTLPQPELYSITEYSGYSSHGAQVTLPQGGTYLISESYKSWGSDIMRHRFFMCSGGMMLPDDGSPDFLNLGYWRLG